MTPNGKPREWVLPLRTLIINDGKGLSAWARQDRENETHVVEHEAYRRAVEALKRIVKKMPEKVSREEAADMACEFKQIATATLRDLGEGE